MAIQKGKTLKKAAQRVMDENKSRKPSAKKEESGGDLMSALRERMQLRRKGISGSRKGVEEEQGGNGPGGADDNPVPRMPGIAEPRGGEVAESGSTAVDDDDDAPISMGNIRKSLQASQANLLAKEPAADDDDGDWSDDD